MMRYPVSDLLRALMGSEQYDTEVGEFTKGVGEGASLGIYSPPVSPDAWGRMDLPLLGETSPSRLLGDALGGVMTGGPLAKVASKGLRPVLGNSFLSRYMPKDKELYELEELANKINSYTGAFKTRHGDPDAMVKSLDGENIMFNPDVVKKGGDTKVIRGKIDKGEGTGYYQLIEEKAKKDLEEALGKPLRQRPQALKEYKEGLRESVDFTKDSAEEFRSNLEDAFITGDYNPKAESWVKQGLEGKLTGSGVRGKPKTRGDALAQATESGSEGFSPRTRQIVDTINKPMVDVGTFGGIRPMSDLPPMPNPLVMLLRKGGAMAAIAHQQKTFMEEKYADGEVSTKEFLDWKYNSSKEDKQQTLERLGFESVKPKNPFFR